MFNLQFAKISLLVFRDCTCIFIVPSLSVVLWYLLCCAVLKDIVCGVWWCDGKYNHYLSNNQGRQCNGPRISTLLLWLPCARLEAWVSTGNERFITALINYYHLFLELSVYTREEYSIYSIVYCTIYRGM